MRILLIEDEPLLGDAVRSHLARFGHAVDWVQTIKDADSALQTVDYGLALLDLHLPDGLGLNLLKLMRSRQSRTPVIILTARDQVRDRIAGLNAGADDYIVKPFDLDELVARVLAVERRYGDATTAKITIGSITIDSGSRQVWNDGVAVQLTAREWALLESLTRRKGAIISKSQIEETLYAFGQEIESNAVEVYVSRLRKKLGSTSIQTVRGLGYRFGS